MAARKICFKCGYEGETDAPKCPQCGRGLRSKSVVRALGGVVVVLGMGLMAGMAMLTLWAYKLIHKSGSSGARFTGTEEQMHTMLSVFGFVFVFGLVGVVAGLWQLIFGRRNLVLVGIMIVLAVLLFLASLYIQGTWK